MAARTLSEEVTAAVEVMLADRVEIAPDEAMGLLPAHVAAARPSKKSVLGAIVAAGWRATRDADKKVIYRAPQLRSDPLQRHGEPGSNIAADELRLLIERAERLEEEKKGITDDIKDVFAEGKNRGYDVKAMRKIMAIRKKKKEEWQEEEAILEVYMIALGMV